MDELRAAPGGGRRRHLRHQRAAPPSSTPSRSSARWPSGPSRPPVLIDLAVPRDVEPAVGELPGVELHDIDALEAVVSRNRAARAGEAGAGRGDRRGRGGALPPLAAVARRRAGHHGPARRAPRPSALPELAALRGPLGVAQRRAIASSCERLDARDRAQAAARADRPPAATARSTARGATSPPTVHELFDLPVSDPRRSIALGTRGSRLALAQAELAGDGAARAGPRRRGRADLDARRPRPAPRVRGARRPRHLRAGDRGGAAGRPRRRRRALRQGPDRRRPSGAGARRPCLPRADARDAWCGPRDGRSGDVPRGRRASAPRRCGARAELLRAAPGPRRRAGARQRRHAPAQARRAGARRGPAGGLRARAPRAGGARSASACPSTASCPRSGQGVVVLQTRRGEEGARGGAGRRRRPRRAAGRARRGRPRSAAAARAPVAAHAAPGGRRLDRAGVGRRARRRRVAGRDGERPDPAPPRRRSPTACCAGRGGAARGSARMTVYLVGAGPGRPRADHRARRSSSCARADVLVYDRLAGARAGRRGAAGLPAARRRQGAGPARR